MAASAGRETPDVSELRREMSLLCDHSGEIAWADDPATRLLGVAAGDTLVSRAAPGTEAKLLRLLELGAEGPVRDWEVCLLVDGTPQAVSFALQPGPDGRALLVGSLVPAQYSSMVQHVHQTVADLGEMQRQSERQRRELQRPHDELARLNHELDDSARGMAALHAEVAQSADSLRRLSEVKSRIVSNVSHEFRTPLNSIIGLTNLLLTRVDGGLSSEQEKQITFIRRSAESLTELVNDLLDLSSIESGKVAFRPATFTIASIYGALRGMMRPLVASAAVDIVFEADGEDITLDTDEGKVSQILRNLLSNALKFTPNGEIRVSSRAEAGDVLIAVRDTGIGIAETDHARIFEEFTQLDGALQRRVKGTGLGLALSRRLAGLLGGTLTVASRLGEGSTFTLRIPRVHPEISEMVAQERSHERDPRRAPTPPQLAGRTGPIRTVLVVDDDDVARYMLRRQLADTGYRLIEATNGAEGLRLAQTGKPQAIFLDLVLPDANTFDLLDDLKSNPSTRGIPVIIHTSKPLAEDEKQRLSQQVAAFVPKQRLSREVALGRIRDALVAAGVGPMASEREASSAG